MRNLIGTLAFIAALSGIVMAVFQDDLRPPPPPAQEQLKEKILHLGKDFLNIKHEKKDDASKDMVAITYITLGILGLCLASISYIKKENPRISGVAGALSIMAIAWEYVLVGVVVAVVLLIMVNLDLDIF